VRLHTKDEDMMVHHIVVEGELIEKRESVVPICP